MITSQHWTYFSYRYFRLFIRNWLFPLLSFTWVLINPWSQRKATELPSWNWSPYLWPLTGTPGSWHSFCPKADRKQHKNIKNSVTTLNELWGRHICQNGKKDGKKASLLPTFKWANVKSQPFYYQPMWQLLRYENVGLERSSHGLDPVMFRLYYQYPRD